MNCIYKFLIVTWDNAILTPLQLYLAVLVLSIHRKETKSALYSGLVCKSLVFPPIVLERLIHLVKECSGMDSSGVLGWCF